MAERVSLPVTCIYSPIRIKQRFKVWKMLVNYIRYRSIIILLKCNNVKVKIRNYVCKFKYFVCVGKPRFFYSITIFCERSQSHAFVKKGKSNVTKL